MKELMPSTQVPPLKQELGADERQVRVRSTLRSSPGETTPCLPGRNTQTTSRDFIARWLKRKTKYKMRHCSKPITHQARDWYLTLSFLAARAKGELRWITKLLFDRRLVPQFLWINFLILSHWRSQRPLQRDTATL